MIKQTVFSVLAHSRLKRSNIRNLLNEWHWQMLSILVGVILPVVSRGAGGSGREQTAEWARCSPEPEQLRPGGPVQSGRRAASGARLFDEFGLLRERGWGLSAHSELFLKLSGSHYPNLRRVDKKLSAEKPVYTGTQLIDSCAQNRRGTTGGSVPGLWE